jgi:hypothetical protein
MTQYVARFTLWHTGLDQPHSACSTQVVRAGVLWLTLADVGQYNHASGQSFSSFTTPGLMRIAASYQGLVKVTP